MTDQLPALLLPASAEDVFPDLSRPLRRLGWQLLAAVSVSAVAAVFWPFHETVRATGLVRPSGENTQVQSLLGGSVERVSVRANQQVRAGQVLAVLDRRGLQDLRRQLRDELATLERLRLQSSQRRAALAAAVQRPRPRGLDAEDPRREAWRQLRRHLPRGRRRSQGRL